MMIGLNKVTLYKLTNGFEINYCKPVVGGIIVGIFIEYYMV